MAGDWIKMRGNLWDDPRIAKLCDITDCSEAQIIGGLYWLWSTADQHTEDGCMPGLTLRQIDRKTGIPGFGAALCEIEWIKDDPQGVVIARFTEHNGTSAKRRCMEAQRKANSRKPSACDADTEQTESGDSAELEKEKRREEISTTPNGVVVASDADRPDACPHKKIIELYHEILPMCPSIRDWTPTRQQALRARWNEDANRQNLDYWRDFFTYVRSCDFLVGRTPKPFFADLEWLTKAQNFVRVREGRYENRRAA